MIRIIFLLTVVTLFRLTAGAQSLEIYPTHWWAGMKMNAIQLLIRDPSGRSGDKTVTSSDSRIQIAGVHAFSNPHYLAVDMLIADDAKPGEITFVIKSSLKQNEFKWSLLERRVGRGDRFARGVSSADLIYLIIPDRFSNGDQKNDKVKGMRDQSLDRDSIYLRHGGDLQGVINHIPYFRELGVSALWLLPVMENDRPDRTEHGYAITNHYKIDPRFGGESKYHELIEQLHSNGMKIIMDAVYNHIGLEHFLEQDRPAADWMHRWPVYTQTNYREQTWFDPYAAPSEKKKMADGWFDTIMPDINHYNPFMANFLIQNMIWYIETFGIDAIRVDTYTYSDQEFANRCNNAILTEYPTLTMFGETRVLSTVSQAYFNRNVFNTPFKSNLQGSVDFQCLYNGIVPALTQPFGWMEGVSRLYNTLSNDFLNENAMRNVLLLDNHDEPRFFSVVNGDLKKQMMGYQWLLTCRGIPQLYYGSEVLLTGVTWPRDGYVRADFPGGWTNDRINAFTGKGLSVDQQSMQTLVKKLGQFRAMSTALKSGKLMHYAPVEGMYVYFRYDDRETIMCVMNTSDKEQVVDFGKYPERLSGFSKGRNVLDDHILRSRDLIPAMTMWVIQIE